MTKEILEEFIMHIDQEFSRNALRLNLRRYYHYFNLLRIPISPGESVHIFEKYPMCETIDNDEKDDSIKIDRMIECPDHPKCHKDNPCPAIAFRDLKIEFP